MLQKIPLFSSAVRYWHLSDTRLFAQRFVRAYRLVGPYIRRLFWINQLIKGVTMVLTTCTFALMALFLLMFSNTDIINEQAYFETVKNVFGLESQKQILILSCVALACFTILDRVVGFWLSLIRHRNDINCARDISVTLYGYYLTQNYCYSPGQDSNALIKKAMTAPSLINSTLSPPIAGVLYLFNIVAIVSALLYVNAVVTIALGIGLLAYYLLYYKVTRKHLHIYGKKLYELRVDEMKLLRTGITPFMDVMFDGKELEFRNVYNSMIEKQGFWKARKHMVTSIIQPLLRVLSMVFVCCLAIYLLATGAAHDILPTIAVFVTAGLRLMPLTTSLNSIVLQSQIKRHEYYKTITDLETAFRLKQKFHDLGQLEGLGLKRLIKLKDISYRYPNQAPLAIDEINLELPVGKKIALCGPSGSGKTTLARMICGLLPPTKGQVSIDDLDIWSDLNLRRQWHASIGMMQQQPFFLDESIAANVAFSLRHESIDLDRVHEVIEAVHLDELIDSLPQGIHTPTGENALQLSGGQAQRLSIARALYNNAPLLILDETTSALDAITEKKILGNLTHLGNQTVVVIAHRLEIMKDLDCIYVMQDGRIIAQGTHDELMESCTLFQKLARQYTPPPEPSDAFAQ